MMKKTMLAWLLCMMLCAVALAESCAICGGDGVCDTCGGKGYEEMPAYGGGVTKVLCSGENCADGKCTSCGNVVSAALGQEKASIAKEDGKILMDPGKCLDNGTLNGHSLRGDYSRSSSPNYVGYNFYTKEGGYSAAIKKGSKVLKKDVDEYVRQLVETGYYEIIKETTSGFPITAYWELCYIGPDQSIKPAKEKSKEYAWHVLLRIRESTTGDVLEVSLVDGLRFEGVKAPDEERASQERKDSITAAANAAFPGPSESSPSSSSSSSSSWSSSSSSSSTTTRTKSCTSCSFGKVPCSQCGGRGYFEKRVSVPNYSGKGSKYETVKEDCGKCRGRKTQDCSRCDGTGKVEY